MGLANLCEKVLCESMGRSLLPGGLPHCKCLIANQRLDSGFPLSDTFVSVRKTGGDVYVSYQKCLFYPYLGEAQELHHFLLCSFNEVNSGSYLVPDQSY